MIKINEDSKIRNQKELQTTFIIRFGFLLQDYSFSLWKKNLD